MADLPEKACHTATPGTPETYPPRQTLDSSNRPEHVRLNPQRLLAHLTGVLGVAGVAHHQESSNGAASRPIEPATPADFQGVARCGSPTIRPNLPHPATPADFQGVAEKNQPNPLPGIDISSPATPATPSTPQKTRFSKKSEPRANENKFVNLSARDADFEGVAGVAGVADTPVTAATRAALLARYGPLVQIAASLDEAREIRLAELLALIDEPTAATLAGDTAALLALARRLVEQGRIRPVVYRRVVPAPSGVRCIDCRHHRRTAHPRLIDCAAGVEPTNPIRLWWDTDRRGCASFEATPC